MPYATKSIACPALLALDLIANKWSIRLLGHLLHAEDSTMRFSELKRALTGITQRELTKQLREFEKAALIERTVYAQVPPKVEYTLTVLGASLWNPIEELSKWAEQNGAEIERRRAEFESRRMAA